jgi:hypothetical protein
MQPSIKPTRLLEGHPIENKGRIRHGDIGHITKVHIWTFLHWWKLDITIIVWCGMPKLDNSQHWQICWNEGICRGWGVATPLWPSVGVKPNTSEVGDLESSGTPECLEFDSKAQNYSHWGVLGVIGKVLKRRYRKWPRIGHLDIFSPSYGQKKGRESNWQFDSRPLKVGNRPLSDIRFESATRLWKDLDKGYNFGSDLVAIRLCNRELWAPKVPGLQPGQFRDSNLGVSGKKAIWL